jgi:CBS domain-containing protein
MNIVERVLATGLDPNTTAVGDVMTRAPTTVPEDASIESALSLMRSGRFRRLPVVDAEGKLIGLLSLDEVGEDFSVAAQRSEHGQAACRGRFAAIWH